MGAKRFRPVPASTPKARQPARAPSMPSPAAPHPHRPWLAASLCGLILLATLTAYWEVHSADFIILDDTLYVTANPHVQKGLQGESIAWAFTTTHASN